MWYYVVDDPVLSLDCILKNNEHTKETNVWDNCDMIYKQNISYKIWVKKENKICLRLQQFRKQKNIKRIEGGKCLAAISKACINYKQNTK